MNILLRLCVFAFKSHFLDSLYLIVNALTPTLCPVGMRFLLEYYLNTLNACKYSKNTLTTRLLYRSNTESTQKVHRSNTESTQKRIKYQGFNISN